MKLYLYLLKFMGVKIEGVPRYISSTVKFDNFSLITICDRVVISANVVLLTHDYSCTTAYIAKFGNPESDFSINKNIYIGANTFIGMNSMLLPGVSIDGDCIIGAGSIVRGFIGCGGVYGGNPLIYFCDLEKISKKTVNCDGKINSQLYKFD
jgi:acetyltransferase-like isoleucine patch superfamily enzyme